MATQKEIAEHLSMSLRNVPKVLKTLGLPSKGNTLDEARNAYILHLREVASGRTGDDSDYDLAAERARLAHHQANKTSLEEDVLKGELIPAEEVLEKWSKMVSSFRAKMLAIPTKTSHLLINIQEFSVAESILKSHIYDALKELSEQGNRQ